MSDQVKINIGRQKDSGKWHAVMTLPDGSVKSTPGFETREECKLIVSEWLEENSIDFDWTTAQ
jgi:hypothetical protein